MRFLLLLLVLSLLGCGSGKSSDAAEMIAPAPDEIVFLTFKMEKDSLAHRSKITLLGKSKAIGKLKSGTEHTDKPNFLTVELTQHGELSKSFTIPHPLFKHLEYLNDQQQLAVKDAIVDQEEFFFRLQTKGDGYSIRIYETLKDQPKTELLTFPL